MKVGHPARAARTELHRLQRYVLSSDAHRSRWADVDAQLAGLTAGMPDHVELQEIVREIRLMQLIGSRFVQPDNTVAAADLAIERLMDEVGVERPKLRACWHGFAAGMQDDHERAAWWFLYAASIADRYTPLFAYSRTVLPTAAFDAAPSVIVCPPDISFGPPPAAADRLFIVSCDAVYLARYGEQYVTSIRRLCGDQAAIHIHLVGMADAAAVAQLGVSWSLEPGELHDLRSRSAIGRYVVAPYVMAQSAARWCVVTDIDTVFDRAGGAANFELPPVPVLRSVDFGLIHGLPWKRVIANFAGFPNTVEMRAALQRLSWAMRTYLRQGQLNWGIDQNVLYAWKCRQMSEGMTFAAARQQPLMNMMRSVKITPAAAENAAAQSGA